MPKLSKLRTLSCTQWHYLISALILLPILRLALRVWGFRPTYAVLQRTAPRPAGLSASPTANEVSDLARLVNAAANHGPIRAACLPRSLALWWMLRRRAIASDLRIGVNRDGREFQAHAWVEYGGAVINDNPEAVQRFAAFDETIADVELMRA